MTYDNPGQEEKFQREKKATITRNLLQRSLALTLQNIDDCGPCDHRVNVCVCSIIKLADDIETELKK